MFVRNKYVTFFLDKTVILVPISEESVAFFGLQEIIVGHHEPKSLIPESSSSTLMSTQASTQQGTNSYDIMFL